MDHRHLEYFLAVAAQGNPHPRRGGALDRPAVAVRDGGAELRLLDGDPPGGLLHSTWLVDHELGAVLSPCSDPVGPTMTIADLVPLGLVTTPQGTALRALLDERREAAGRPPARVSDHLVWHEGRLSPLARHLVDVATGDPTDGER